MNDVKASNSRIVFRTLREVPSKKSLFNFFLIAVVYVVVVVGLKSTTTTLSTIESIFFKRENPVSPCEFESDTLASRAVSYTHLTLPTTPYV